MSSDAIDTLVCGHDARRAALRSDPSVQGIDYVEVSADQLTIAVHFIDEQDPARQPALTTLRNRLQTEPGRVSIEGGTRVRDIRVESVAVVGQHVAVAVARYGDFSTYTLRIDPSLSGIDPAFASVEFSFKAGCESRFDCRPGHACPPETLPERPIDYMAKDYASFRQALLDLIPTLVPDWEERLEADLGITLVELLAYVGDQLSYFQDAVANEAYLATARQRVSVRRHARLVDYAMHDGLSARAFVHFRASAAATVPAQTRLLTRLTRPVAASPTTPGPVIAGLLPSEAEQALDAAEAVFETLADARVDPALNRVAIYDWGDSDCCLPRGATEADLEGNLGAQLQPGDFLLFEEILGPETREAADADPRHRQVVRLTGVRPGTDTLPTPDRHYTHVEWAAADALTFPLCVSVMAETTSLPVSVARGNLALAMHGRRYEDWNPADPGTPPDPGIAGVRTRPSRAYRFRLGRGGLGFEPAAAAGDAPVAVLMDADPRRARPRVKLQALIGGAFGPAWTPRRDLLSSAPAATDFAVETEDDAGALIRFGSGDFGAAPPEHSHLRVRYHVGVGRAGNVGAGAIAHALEPGASGAAIEAIRNPLAAFGGVDPEPVDVVRAAAPVAFRSEQLRAVIETDYARAALRSPEVAGAVATFRWTGSWMTVFITVDRRGRTELDDEFVADVRATVEEQTQAGYDLEIERPEYVAIELEVAVCVDRGHFRTDVERAVLTALAALFDPDNWTFGQPVYVSQLYAAVESVEGVESAVVTALNRFGRTPQGELAAGLLPIGRFEIAQLENDPSFPERGAVRLDMRGGK
jgi:hypothetical protein